MEDDKTRYHQVTSDEYFELRSKSNHKSQLDVFDLFFIDGLHTYDQTYRDFCNCLGVSKSDSFFVIDDTVPADLYSSLRSHAACKLEG